VFAQGDLSLAMTPMGINDTLKIPLQAGARIAIKAIATFLRGSQRIREAGGLRLWLYTGSAASHAVFEAELALVTPRDERLVLLPLDISGLFSCDPASRPAALGGAPIGAFVHEIDRRGKGLYKKESKQLEEAVLPSPQHGQAAAAAVGQQEVGLFARTKASIAAANGHTSTVAVASSAYSVPLPPGTPLGARVRVAIAVRPPSMNADRQGVGKEEAETELRRSWTSVLAAFATHAGLDG
jgi:hypothetical protein